MNPTPARSKRHLAGNLAGTLLVALLGACGGTESDGTLAEGRAQALALAPPVVPTLLDDEGRLMPGMPSAVPADAGARTRNGRYASPAQAAQLEGTLGVMVIPVMVETGPDAAAAVELATQMAYGHQAVHDLPASAPVLVRGGDLRLAAAAVHQLEAAGYTRVILVTH